MLMLHRLLAIDSHIYTPAGFIDEDPDMEGKYINGFPVFGGHWKLEHLVRKEGIKHLFVSEEFINPKVSERIEDLSKTCNLQVRKFQVNFNEIPFMQKETPQYPKEKMSYAAKG
jgi:FlaA1/EpsC-like NDP-sugar epimerase